MLAVTLVHELAHAVYMCRFPSPPPVLDNDPLLGTTPQVRGPATDENPTPAASPPFRQDHMVSHKEISLPNGKPFPHPLPSRATTSRRPCPRPPLLHKAYEEHEPFYSVHRKPELGHAWETTVFGSGKILSLASCDDFRIGLGWQRWPGADDFYVNNERGDIVPLCRRNPDGRPWGAPKWETVYVVSDAWAWKWFLSSFWERVEVEGLNKVSGLGRVEKGLGARVRNYDWVDEGVGDGWVSDCISRRRGVDREGIVREGQAWVDSENDEDEDEDED